MSQAKITTAYQTAAFVVLLGFMLWFGKPLLIPLAYALFIAVVLYPICKYFEKKGLGKSLSIALPIVLLSILFGGLIALLSYEVALLAGKWSVIHEKLDPLLIAIQSELESQFGWTAEKQIIWVKDNLTSLVQNAGEYLTNTLSSLAGGVFNLIIIPIYVSLILAFRSKLIRFATDIAPVSFRDKMQGVMENTIKVFSKFIRGMFMVYLIVGVLNSIGLWIIGVENPILYGMITAVMTIIPYFGIVISALLPITLAWIETGTLWQPLGVVAVFAVVQYLEANLIFPYVVGKFVNINTLAGIVAIFLGALLWGVSGMILFLPLLAVFRLFAEHFPGLKPWSRLLGDSKD